MSLLSVWNFQVLLLSAFACKMKANLILDLACIAVLCKGAFSQHIPSYFVTLNTPYTFSLNASDCRHAEWRKIHPTDATIATYNNHVCTPGKGFEGKLSCKDNHLHLKSAKSTDKGRYEFICDGVKTFVKLDVIYAENVSAVEMGNITLKCYAHSAKDVTWLRNKERVLHCKMDRSVNVSEDYKKRASLEKNCFETGDFSLTIAHVLMADAGIYRCFVDDETLTGNPHATVLHVNEKSSGPDQTHYIQTTLIVLTVVLGLLLAISVTFNVRYVFTTKECRCQSTYTEVPQSSENNSPKNDLLVSSDNPTTPVSESQPAFSHPVPESNYMETKPSNTRPF